jgi:hypothetical protein
VKTAILVLGAVSFNADEAVVALMARHILQGERPVFFYGQAYMGSLDAYLIAAGFAVFGEEVWVLRLVQVLLYMGTLYSTYLLGKAALGTGEAGVLAAWLMAIPAVNVTLYTTVTLGGYGEMLLLGNLILLATLRIAKQLTKGRRPRAWNWLAFGFLTGFGLWAFGLSLVYSFPAILFLAWTAWKAGPVSDPARLRMPAELRPGGSRRERLLECAGWAYWIAAGSLAGAAPWWGYALATGSGSSLSELGGSALAGVDRSHYLIQVVRHVFNLVVLGLPAAVGMRPPWEVRWLAFPLLPFALAFWLGVALFTIHRLFRHNSERSSISRPRTGISSNSLSRNSRMALICQEVSSFSPVDPDYRWLLAGVLATLFAGFVLTPFGADPSGRYFTPLGVVMALFGTETVLHVRRSWGRWAYSLVGLVLAFNTWGTLECALRTPPGLTTQFDAQTRIDQRDDPALMEFLLENGETTGYSTYWVSYPLAFKSEEALVFVPDLPYHLDLRHTARDNRYEPYAQRVEAAERAAFITVNHPALDRRLRDGFNVLSVQWQEQQIGDYRVFYGLSRHVRPAELDLTPAP